MPTGTNEGRVYVLHGRKGGVPASNIDLLNRFIEESGVPSAIGFLEGDQQTLEDAVRQVQQAGSTHITVVPVLLYTATHVRWDIPERVLAVLDPGVQATELPPLADTKAIESYLDAQLSDAVRQHPDRTVLLVVHGTGHFDGPWNHLQALVSRLREKLQVPVLGANLIAEPKIATVLATTKAPLLVQRLFLTDGRLANRIENLVREIQPDSVFLPTLEDNQVILDAISERLHEGGRDITQEVVDTVREEREADARRRAAKTK